MNTSYLSTLLFLFYSSLLLLLFPLVVYFLSSHHFIYQPLPFPRSCSPFCPSKHTPSSLSPLPPPLSPSQPPAKNTSLASSLHQRHLPSSSSSFFPPLSLSLSLFLSSLPYSTLTFTSILSTCTTNYHHCYNRLSLPLIFHLLQSTSLLSPPFDRSSAVANTDPCCCEKSYSNLSLFNSDRRLTPTSLLLSTLHNSRNPPKRPRRGRVRSHQASVREKDARRGKREARNRDSAQDGPLHLPFDSIPPATAQRQSSRSAIVCLFPRNYTVLTVLNLRHVTESSWGVHELAHGR